MLFRRMDFNCPNRGNRQRQLRVADRGAAVAGGQALGKMSAYNAVITIALGSIIATIPLGTRSDAL